MTPLPLLEPIAPASPEVEDFDHDWSNVLNALRMIALECRVAAQTDLFEACALLSNRQQVAQDAHARALLKCLREAISNKPVFYRPGSREVSFDEAWLMRALTAANAGDDDSFTFLLRSRVPKQHQRLVAFLIRGISEQFSQV
ncbi:hypothetical protein [Yoonia sp. BS5-3]|uniref:Uncharacterized protein n=1 Tax=Yoonia phaeophyticola TaxID=3137369 RepID=A0ABZ2V0N1_9RHOB